MITKAQIRFIRSLELKKNRDATGCFLVEGEKMVKEALDLPEDSDFGVAMVIGTDSWFESELPVKPGQAAEWLRVGPSELERISLQKTPNQVMAVIRRKAAGLFPGPFDGLFLGLDRVQDPGNVGTIIRLADWFGLAGIIASPDSADYFSPKVVQSSMGSIFRVKLVTADLPEFIRSLPGGFPVYATRLEGDNIYMTPLTDKGLILMGNESKGLGTGLSVMATRGLMIPGFASGDRKPESLNVSIAAAIVCSEFRRRHTS
jgi:TrmH family RNA methyltransferase